MSVAPCQSAWFFLTSWLQFPSVTPWSSPFQSTGRIRDGALRVIGSGCGFDEEYRRFHSPTIKKALKRTLGSGRSHSGTLSTSSRASTIARTAFRTSPALALVRSRPSASSRNMRVKKSIWVGIAFLAILSRFTKLVPSFAARASYDGLSVKHSSSHSSRTHRFNRS